MRQLRNQGRGLLCHQPAPDGSWGWGGGGGSENFWNQVDRTEMCR